MYLKQLTLANVRGFIADDGPARLDFTRPDGSFAGWTVITGRNGTGKSTLLRAIALSVAGPTVARSLVPGFSGWVSNGARDAYVHAAFTVGPQDAWATGGQPPKQQPWAGLRWTVNDDGPEPTLTEDLPPKAPKLTPRRGPWYENPQGWFLAGYGPFRRLTGAATEAQRLMLGQKRVASLVTLFDESASLAESTWWLQDLYPRMLEKDPQATSLLTDIIALLNDGLLPDDYEIRRYDSSGLWVERHGVSLVLEEMSDGYRTVAALVLDIVRRIHASYGTFKLTVDEDGNLVCPQEGVVLIDEIDVHLHVSWQQRIGFWLRDHFPRIQFIVSTHSPFVCQAASANGIIRLPAPNDVKRMPHHVDADLFTVVVNGSVDEVVMSELFGLDSSRSDQSEALRAELRSLEVRAIDEALSASELERLNVLRGQVSQRPSIEVVAALSSLNDVIASRSDA